MPTQLKILELFAGVGGFRVGLENSNPDIFKTKWSNQWEPARKTQDAFEVYQHHFPNSENINEDIANISDEKFSEMDADLIVGGFPCQDYSVARSKKNEMGIEGKKGVLFWEIIRSTRIIKPDYLILENVDRLLKAPSKQRGRDFAIMLTAFNQLNYSVEWRVINAAEYGRAQRRRRVFIFIYRNDSIIGKYFSKKFPPIKENELFDENYYNEYIFKNGLFARQFPVINEANKGRIASYSLPNDIVDTSDNFSGVVWNSGIMRHGKYFTIDTLPTFEEEPIPLGEIVQSNNQIDNKYFLDEAKIEKFEYLRGAKKIERTAANGHTYTFSEGSMSQFDDLSLPGRTMLTSEGTVNRSTHLLMIDGRYRLLTPIEAERLQDFPDDWTKYKLLSDGSIAPVNDRMRMFFMGNALVTGIVKRIGDELQNLITEAKNEVS
ncbi:DNA (cytosine-5-)-methyltransferase [Ignavigranum ruoffiae]|uniref:DNA (cytosine-5-)-methyltransferase n=1 Tax=Ignavigranum ruoffiae TaxID=89093 RepID=UPI003B00BE6A